MRLTKRSVAPALLRGARIVTQLLTIIDVDTSDSLRESGIAQRGCTIRQLG
jgi:hypothetical protein